MYIIYLCSMTKSLADYRKQFLQLKLSLANYLLFQKISKSDHVYHKGKIVIGNHVQICTSLDPAEPQPLPIKTFRQPWQQWKFIPVGKNYKKFLEFFSISNFIQINPKIFFLVEIQSKEDFCKLKVLISFGERES